MAKKQATPKKKAAKKAEPNRVTFGKGDIGSVNGLFPIEKRPPPIHGNRIAETLQFFEKALATASTLSNGQAFIVPKHRSTGAIKRLREALPERRLVVTQIPDNPDSLRVYVYTLK